MKISTMSEVPVPELLNDVPAQRRKRGVRVYGHPALADENRVFRPDPQSPAGFPLADNPPIAQRGMWNLSAPRAALPLPLLREWA